MINATEAQEFQDLVNRAMQAGGRAHMRPVIEKELLHYDLLFQLDKEGLLDRLTFQGGTALRLCYGAPRFSEDLDFVGGHDFKPALVGDIKTCVEGYIGKRYGLEVSVKEPKTLQALPEYQSLKINKWQIKVVTSMGQPDLPSQKIKIEIANIPAYERLPKALMHNYDFLPDGYRDTLIMAESLNEILADKIISLVNCDKYVRHRDIWDLLWLKQQGAQLDRALLENKKADYKITDLNLKIEHMASSLPDIIHGKAFTDQMTRFTPEEVQERTLLRPQFYHFLQNEIQSLLKSAKNIGSNKEDEFMI